MEYTAGERFEVEFSLECSIADLQRRIHLGERRGEDVEGYRESLANAVSALKKFKGRE